MISSKSLVKSILSPKIVSKLREQYLSMNVTHLYGKKNIKLSRYEAAVTCVLRNGEYYIESFIEHYLNKGFRHIFFLDNGSTDATIPIAKRYREVSIFKSSLPISSNQRIFKKYLAQTTISGGWCLDADIDEFFDYPFSDDVDLKKFITYLNNHQYTAVITQLLDMFSDRPFSSLSREKEKDIKSIYRYYDLSDMARTDYNTSTIVKQYGAYNKLAGDAALYWGGIRKTLYGNNCLLTKHSLFLPEAKVDLFPHVHFINKANIADVSGVMMHYKLTGNAMAVALQNKNNFTENSATYGAFIETLQKDSDRMLRKATAQEFNKVSGLTSSGFLFTSPTYEHYAATSGGANERLGISDIEDISWQASKA